ncbi:hypothetical protein KPL70_017175 [Citrus sinensis]|nr:hypothetical protein KPL70_017175 [Citrus sinensis]
MGQTKEIDRTSEVERVVEKYLMKGVTEVMSIKQAGGLSSTPWLCFGDFNEILHPYEKSRGNERQLSLITYFREALRDCDLLDVGYKGYPFTWSNGRFGPAFVEEKLARFVCISAWRDIFSDSTTTNIDTWTSDHCPVVMEITTALSRISRRVSSEMNDLLKKPFTTEEVVEALTQMCPTKAPGPDGLSVVFYQKHWQTVKIVAKAIANRFKHVLQKIISPMQSAFIPNRLITDNIIVGYECLYKIRHCKGRKKRLVALKLDVSKAYDRLEWTFLEQAMKPLEFSQNWVSLIMRCISSVSSSVAINGTHKFFSVGGKEILIKEAAQAIPAYAKCRGGMGLRDFSNFNQALVAKQGWRILQFPDSLVTKILQARWRVGNGQSILIHKENWPPRPLTFKPVSKPNLPADALAVELISEEHSSNEWLIHRHFFKMDAEAIVKIPLPRRPMKDEIIWHYDRKCKYTVKSGYQIALSLKFLASLTSSAAAQNQWNIIWLLTLPEKIRISAWRAAKNLLPSTKNL